MGSKVLLPPSLLVLSLALLLGSAGPGRAGEGRTLRFVDETGAPVPEVEACFWFGPTRRCRTVPPGAEVHWPPEATALRAEGPGHGPIRIEADQLPADGGLTLPRKAILTVEDLPRGATLAFYRPTDPVFRVPLEEIRPVDPRAPVRVPSGATILAIRAGDPDAGPAPGQAPDLHRVEAPPGGRATVHHRPRNGWSAVVRVIDGVRRRPLDGAWVRLIATEPTAPAEGLRPLATMRTGPDGLALFSGLSAPMVTAVTGHPDRATHTTRGLISPPGSLLAEEIRLRPGGMLDALIFWRGKPADSLPWALFALPVGTAVDDLPDEEIRRGRTDLQGRIRTGHLPAGRYALRIEAPDGAGRAVLPVPIEDREVQEIAASLEPVEIRGRVLRAGSPAPGYRLRARPASAAIILDRDVTGDDGRYTLTVLEPGPHAVDLYSPDGTRVHSELVPVDSRGASADFELREGLVVAGRVVSSRGGALPGARIALHWPSPPGTDPVRWTTADGNGRFQVQVPSAGRGRVHGTLDGYEPAAVEVAVGHPDAPRTVELTLHPLARTRGRVVSGRGEPVAGAWVTACTDTPGAPPLCLGESVTGDDGRFALPASPPPGRHLPRDTPVRLWVSGPGCPLVDVAAPGWLDGPGRSGDPENAWAGDGATEPGPLTIRCDTPPAVLRLHVATSASHPLAGRSVVLRRDRTRVVPRQVLDGHLDHLGLPRRTDARGQLLLILSPRPWEAYLDPGPGSTRSPLDPGDDLPRQRLGATHLAPRTLTDLYTGADPR